MASVNTAFSDAILARKHPCVPVCVCFQSLPYLLWCVDHTDVVSELQRSQDGSEDGENKGSRHCLKTHSDAPVSWVFQNRGPLTLHIPDHITNHVMASI